MKDIPLHRHAQALEHLLGYRCDGDQKLVGSSRSPLDHFTIALARQVGAPAAEIAQEIGQRLGWEVYDQQLTEMMAEKLGLLRSVIENVDEKPQHWLLECLEALSPHPTLSEGRYFRCLLEVIRELGQKGRCIVVGHGASFILSSCTTLRVRLVGSPGDRSAALGRQLHLSREVAVRKMEQVDHDHRRFIQEHFLVDPAEARCYDLVLNSSQWSVGTCADFIMQAMQHRAMAHVPVTWA